MTWVDELQEQLYSSVEPEIVCSEIKNNISEFQKGFKKATPATKRRLIHKVFRKLELTAKGIKVYLSMPSLESRSTNSNLANSNGRINGFEAENSLKSKIKASEDFLSHAFENLLIGGIGWVSAKCSKLAISPRSSNPMLPVATISLNIMVEVGEHCQIFPLFEELGY